MLILKAFIQHCTNVIHTSRWKISASQIQNLNFKFLMTCFIPHGIIWNAPKSMWKMYFSREAICILFWNAPNSNNFSFGSFLVLKLVTCLFFEIPHFSVVKKFEMPHFSYLILKTGKMGHFKIFSIRKMGHFEKKTRD